MSILSRVLRSQGIEFVSDRELADAREIRELADACEIWKNRVRVILSVH